MARQAFATYVVLPPHGWARLIDADGKRHEICNGWDVPLEVALVSLAGAHTIEGRIERLMQDKLATEAALRQLAERIIAVSGEEADHAAGFGYTYCRICRRTREHAPDCLVRDARALLSLHRVASSEVRRDALDA